MRSSRQFSKKSSVNKQTMSVMIADYIKVICLIVVTLICAWSYIKSVIWSSSGLSKRLEINVDDAICGKINNIKNLSKDNIDSSILQCKSEILVVYNSAKESCKGYLSTANTCISRATDSRECMVQMNNVNSCVTAIVSPTQQKWITFVSSGGNS